MKTKYYTYNQNNSGGYFDKETGHYVIIEAFTAAQANQIAEEKGIYFNGCDSGSDCKCCGDRWSEVHKSDATKSPKIYGEAWNTFRDKHFEGRKIVVHYLNGESVERII